MVDLRKLAAIDIALLSRTFILIEFGAAVVLALRRTAQGH